MTAIRSKTWLVAVLWGAILFVATWMIPFGFVVALTTLGVAVVVALMRRRTVALSGLLVGAGGLWLVITGAAEVGCRQAAVCERAEATPTFIAIAIGLLVAGWAVVRADRPR